MAEKYGELPKRFTKEWWEYFWDYYKIHTIVATIVLVVIVATIYQALSAPRYEFNIAYSAEANLPIEDGELFRKRLCKYVTDSNGDGKDGVVIHQNTFVSGMDDAQLEQTMIMRMQLEVTDDDTIVYIISKEKLKYMIDASEMAGAFLPVEEWLDEQISQDELYVKNGQAYAVSLNGSKMLEHYGIKSDDLYVAVRAYNKELSDEMKEKIADAINIANAIVE